MGRDTVCSQGALSPTASGGDPRSPSRHFSLRRHQVCGCVRSIYISPRKPGTAEIVGVDGITRIGGAAISRLAPASVKATPKSRNSAVPSIQWAGALHRQQQEQLQRCWPRSKPCAGRYPTIEAAQGGTERSPMPGLERQTRVAAVPKWIAASRQRKTLRHLQKIEAQSASSPEAWRTTSTICFRSS